MAKYSSRNTLFHHADFYGDHAFLHHEIGRRMIDYVEKNDPQSILNDGAFDHYLTELLQVTFPTSLITENIAAVADEDVDEYRQSNIPHHYDLIVSNLLLQDIWEFEERIRVYHDTLNANGRLMLTMIGTGSFSELRSEQGFAINHFPDIQDLGDFMHALGFQDTLLYIEKINLTYEKIESLLRDARVVAGRPFDPFKGLRTPKWLLEAKAGIEKSHNGERYQFSFEVIYAEASRSKLVNRRDQNKNEIYVDINQLMTKPK